MIKCTYYLKFRTYLTQQKISVDDREVFGKLLLNLINSPTYSRHHYVSVYITLNLWRKIEKCLYKERGWLMQGSVIPNYLWKRINKLGTAHLIIFLFCFLLDNTVVLMFLNGWYTRFNLWSAQGAWNYLINSTFS